MADHDDNSIQIILGFPRKMNQCVRAYAVNYLRDTRIKPQYMLLINHIGRKDGTSQKEINEDVPFDKSYISTMVRELIELGYVYNDSSGKQHCLRLTDQGRDIFAMCRMMFDLLDRNLFETLTEEERAQLNSIMRKLDASADRLMAEFSGESGKSLHNS